MFQKTIISKYLKTQNKETLLAQWNTFTAHFHNTAIQENIRNAKEEQYQEGFLRDLFGNVFGYTLNPATGFNLTTEYKNIKDSKKADGAIIIEDKVVGVIELKGTNTTDLGKIEEQAFNYKNNQTACTYVITANFEKLRLYIDDSVRFTEFHLFNLKQDDFNLLYLLLAFENIKNNIPKKIKDESLNQEDIVTKKLYKDYSVFKRELFQNLTLLNPAHDPLELFQKSQKLLDRILFLLFGEDRGLLPPNSVRQILEQWVKLKDLDEYVPLYSRYKKYFGYLNTGFKGKTHDVFAYNGGLFKDDEILDEIKIDDDILYQHTFHLSQYDFASEVDVNILGHIFENSLNEIDEIKAQLAGEEIDRSKTKRKKDGVFYTPKYITKYIVENTVGKLCEEKKTEFQIAEEDYFTDKKRQQKTTKNLLANLDDYRNWLLHITIVDPACGSGAFLNEALNFLIEEHKFIDELEAKLLNVPIIFRYHSESILENNLFGVDLNEESVEIAKLSLWLRTAEPNRKLNSLNDNIKCGNSLIDDPEIAGDKAFNWEREFSQVFEKGGFDVVIGNPPYGAKLNIETQQYLVTNYIRGGGETAISFIKISYDLLLKNTGKFGFIIPKSFCFASNYAEIRNFILADVAKIIDCQKVWKEVLLEQIMLFFTKGIKTKHYETGIRDRDAFKTLGEISKVDFKEFGFYLNGISSSELEIGHKINLSKNYISNVAANSRGGTFQNKISEFGDLRVLGGAEVQRDGVKGIKGKIMKSLIENDQKSFLQENSILIQNIVAHIENPTSHIKITAAYTEDKNYAIVDTVNQITCKPEFDCKVLWLLLNSKLINWYSYRFILAKAIRTIHFDNAITNRIPIPIKINQHSLVEKADSLLSLNKELQQASGKFQRNLEREFSLENLSQKLQSWHQLSYDDFLKELKKQKVILSLSQKADWEHYFNEEKNKAQQIQLQISNTDKEIDKMVYTLYGLSEEEIKIIETA